MDTFEAIMTRRSIRKFKAKVTIIPEGTIERALRAAMAAPSAGSQFCWSFVVVTEREILTQIAAENKNAHMCASATIGVLFVGDPTSERFGPFWQQDMGACVQNFLLANSILEKNREFDLLTPTSARLNLFLKAEGQLVFQGLQNDNYTPIL